MHLPQELPSSLQRLLVQGLGSVVLAHRVVAQGEVGHGSEHCCTGVRVGVVGGEVVVVAELGAPLGEHVEVQGKGLGVVLIDADNV